MSDVKPNERDLKRAADYVYVACGGEADRFFANTADVAAMLKADREELLARFEAVARVLKRAATRPPYNPMVAQASGLSQRDMMLASLQNPTSRDSYTDAARRIRAAIEAARTGE